MKKLSIVAIIICLVTLASCGNSAQKDAQEVSEKMDKLCEVIENAIADEIIDDAEVEAIINAENEFSALSAEYSEKYASDDENRKIFQEELMAYDYQHYADLQAQLAITEGYAKLFINK